MPGGLTTESSGSASARDRITALRMRIDPMTAGRVASSIDREARISEMECPRIFLCALVMGPFDFGEVCSMGLYFIYGI